LGVAWPVHLIMIVGLFAIGTVVGSFLNVCIYRIPWEKSVIWPGSRCPKCLAPIAAQDNIPIVSWVALRGECRDCGAPIAARYPLVEALVGLLFVAVYLVDIVYCGPPIPWGALPVHYPAVLAYHLTFIALLVTATFIDYDLWVIPDEVTVTGMIVGLGMGTLFPSVRPAPGTAATASAGFWVGMTGLLVGAGVTQSVRLLGSLAFRREAMGFGDVTLMGMIGAFMGWQAAILTFFLAAFIGLGHALWKVAKAVKKLITRRKVTSADRELPFGPYLSMAAAVLLLSWCRIWPRGAAPYFETLRVLFWTLLGYDVPFHLGP
jgi:leader peptidase (prepilin peptidase)/N-methyltransferase